MTERLSFGAEAGPYETKDFLQLHDVAFHAGDLGVTRRAPSLSRCSCTTSWMAEAICVRMLCCDMGRPAMPIICSSRETASRGELAWIVAMDPSWPVFIA